ncbi:ATPase/protein kinase [Nonlabens spongiae]|uniref:ATPase/protein kinase n=1 Tax=Nonlabens spongiae TaxID=331648 RepID=A0A1W6MNG0_9FLAO|nr:methylmalonyl Co-A mutase-associated GTPase MeaB [Nonlabens spongiae]ARN79125.1 ATPase/protein kinase [Nonlabens spongiae]
MAANPHINPFSKRYKKELDADQLFQQLRAGSLSALSQAITMVESQAVKDSAFAKAILQQALPHSGKSFRLGITGVPGVGKSTFIETLGKKIVEQGKKLAVLAIDPSSNRSKGSILGDKTRMEELVRSDRAYIRPSPAGKTLGGVARKTREAIILCEAAGYDFIIVETVGVGQSETAVHSMTDFFLLLKLAGAGDDLQGIKRGIMEMADMIAINKADGENATAAKHAVREFKNALHLMPAKDHGYTTQVLKCSGLNDKGVVNILNVIINFKQHSHNNGSFDKRREQQELYWLHQTIEDTLKSRFYSNAAVISKMIEIEKQVILKKLTPFEAAQQLLDIQG